MPRNEFAEFVRRQRAAFKEEEKMDWDKERKEWLEYLDELYSMVAKYLEKYIVEGDILVYYDSIPLEEENIGRYDAKRMHVKIGNQTVRFDPIGTLLIGTKGRVDMVGPRGTVRLILVDKGAERLSLRVVNLQSAERGEQSPEKRKKIDWTWKILSPTSPPTFSELNKESLTQAIMEAASA